MNNLEKLTTLLCEGSERVKEDLNNTEVLYICNRDWKAWDFGTMTDDDFEEVEKEISLKHLLMYCNEKGIELGINNSGELLEGIHIGNIYQEYNVLNIKYNITKELYEQEDKVLLDIINFLKG